MTTAQTTPNLRTITCESLASSDWTREELEGLIQSLQGAEGVGRIGRLVDAAQARLRQAQQQDAA